MWQCSLSPCLYSLPTNLTEKNHEKIRLGIMFGKNVPPGTKPLLQTFLKLEEYGKDSTTPFIFTLCYYVYVEVYCYIPL